MGLDLLVVADAVGPEQPSSKSGAAPVPRSAFEECLGEQEGARDLSLLEKDKLLSTGVVRVQLMRLAMKGMNASEAAEHLGCHRSTARGHYADPAFRAAVLSKVDRAFSGIDSAFVNKKLSLHEMIDNQAVSSFEDLVSLLSDPDLPVHHRVKINQDFLNRCEASQQKAQITHQKFDPAQLQQAAQVAREMDNVIPISSKWEKEETA